jgi:DNA-binding transcriptional regulator GbsR (MarR family)
MAVRPTWWRSRWRWSISSSAALSFADVEARLDISKGSVSQGLRGLREIGAIKVVNGNGDRRDHFAPDLELRKLVMRFLDERLQRQLTDGSQRLKQLSRAVPDFDADNTATLRERIRQLKSWHGKTRADRARVHAVLRVERFALGLRCAQTLRLDVRRAADRHGPRS